MPSRRRSARGGIGSTLLAGLLLVGLGAVVASALARVDVPTLSGRIPATALDAYRTASSRASSVTEACSVEWPILAGIGQVESRHGRIDPGYDLRSNGDVVPPIRGRALDGTGGTQTIPDTDDGVLDGDSTWDRAVGPLQFIPTTWTELGRDGNDDGVSDPDNLYDAALTAVAHLCLREPGNYAQRHELRRALIAYNASGRYAEEVLAWVDRYRTTPLDDLVETTLPADAG